MTEETLEKEIHDIVFNDTEFSESQKKLEEEAIRQVLSEGKTPQEALRISDKLLESLYSQAYFLFESGNYSKAQTYFFLLHQLNPEEIRYLIGLAASFQKQEKYNEAIEIYHRWWSRDILTPYPHYHLGNLYHKIGRDDFAIICYAMAATRCADFPVFSEMKERANLMVKNLKKGET